MQRGRRGQRHRGANCMLAIRALDIDRHHREAATTVHDLGTGDGVAGGQAAQEPHVESTGHAFWSDGTRGLQRARGDDATERAAECAVQRAWERVAGDTRVDLTRTEELCERHARTRLRTTKASAITISAAARSSLPPVRASRSPTAVG